MPSYKDMYISLFNAVTDAMLILRQAQCKCEAEFIESSDDGGEIEQNFMNNE